jgi:lipopolysaccharide export LptBFGC system permease protein LptF
VKIKLLDRYVGRQVAITTLMGVTLLSGVFVLGNVYKKISQLIGDSDVPLSVLMEFILMVLPLSCVYTIPWAFLTSILLVFGRLSSDHELIAMKMSGQSMWRICQPVFVLAAIFCLLSLVMNVGVAPLAKDRTKRLFYELAINHPEALFQPGKIQDKLPEYRIYTGERKGQELKHLKMVQMVGVNPIRVIHAQQANLKSATFNGKSQLQLEMKEVEVETFRVGELNTERVMLETMHLEFPIEKFITQQLNVKADMKTSSQLWNELSTQIDSLSGAALSSVQVCQARCELSKRFSFSLACLTFALVGIPLAITAQRKETSVGFVMSLGVSIAYFFFIVLADTLNNKPQVYPHLLMWLPNIIFISYGWFLFKKLSRQ